MQIVNMCYKDPKRSKQRPCPNLAVDVYTKRFPWHRDTSLYNLEQAKVEKKNGGNQTELEFSQKGLDILSFTESWRDSLPEEFRDNRLIIIAAGDYSVFRRLLWPSDIRCYFV